jgi:deoxyadenosine/deoxycytidine kinase
MKRSSVTKQDPIEELVQTSDIRYIAVEGVIGAGKSSLCRMLAETLGARSVLEKFEDNPFLKDFYKDPERHAFQTQICFLLARYRQQRDLLQADLFQRHIVADYIFEKDKIFAYLNLQDDELKLYEALINSMEHSIPSPDLVIYLQSTVPRLMQTIRKRNREFEAHITEEYVKDLNEAYNYFFFRYKTTPLLIVNAAETDFLNNEEQYNGLLREVFRQNRAPVEYYNPQRG